MKTSFKPKKLPVPLIGINLREYGLYIDAYLSANPDKTFMIDCLPRDFSIRSKSKVVQSMLKKGFWEKVCTKTYKFIMPKVSLFSLLGFPWKDRPKLTNRRINFGMVS